MTILALHHVQLAMPEGREAEARAFYAGLLGLGEETKPEHLARRGGCWFAAGETRLHLGVETDFRPARKAHPALLVDDLFALVTRIERAGFTVMEDQSLEGFERRYVSDPFGNRIELMQRAG
ncbi:VOC family protein [Consotaella salsifontis]|uniref:Predicted dioxygenase of extradiol dioxygenase family n=1 Tax=Consotaella salsifontis TaxID=1365950 RepID=A0A1T4QP94_9HYPH|nr:VOC family protein [Consotaella salsifontis]SKA05506.1 Predicted dioxygenase of extradiol dioxygenase family [Consotaella salsifontis]